MFLGRGPASRGSSGRLSPDLGALHRRRVRARPVGSLGLENYPRTGFKVGRGTGPRSRLNTVRLNCVCALADGPNLRNRFRRGIAVTPRTELQGGDGRTSAAVGSGNKRNNNQEPQVT